MKCNYCGTTIRLRDKICHGCSAPVSNMNRVAGWALFFAALALIGSFFPVFNLPFMLLAVILIVIGYVLAGYKDHNGRGKSTIALLFVLLSIPLTAVMIYLYNIMYDYMLSWMGNNLGGTSLPALAKRMLNIMTLRFLWSDVS